MDSIFAIATLVFLVSLVMLFFKKFRNKKTLIIAAICLVIMIAINPSSDDKGENGDALADEKPAAKEKTSNDKEKTESTKEKKTEKKEKKPVAKDEKKEEKREEESAKDYYVSNVKPAMDEYIAEYDRIWDELWAPTFSGIADESVDIYEAYDNLSSIESQYAELEMAIARIETDKDAQGKDDAKKVGEMRSSFANGAAMRKKAAKQAKKMIDEGAFKPSEIDKIVDTVNLSDSNTIQAIAVRAELESKYGLLDDK